MVAAGPRPQHAGRPFQYSLCRVVLMVEKASGKESRQRKLSVLALSSRFDGQMMSCGG